MGLHGLATGATRTVATAYPEDPAGEGASAPCRGSVWAWIRALIVGAGMGGLVTALALRQSGVFASVDI